MHLLIVAAVVLCGVFSVVAARRRPALWSPLRWGIVLAGSTLGLTWYVYRVAVLHQPLARALPLEVCDVALWITMAALIAPRQRLLELAYFWGVAGAGMALLTPYLIAPLWSVPSVTFLAGHGMIVVAVMFLLGTKRLRPRPHAWLFTWLALNVLGVVDFAVDAVFHVNYMYLMHRPPVASLLDALGPWPWYVLGADALGALLFLLLQVPYWRQPASSKKCATAAGG